MARKRLEPILPPLENWQDVDRALAEIGECQRNITLIEAAMQEEIDRAKAKAQEDALPYRGKIVQMEKQVQTYAELHRDELGGKKSIPLNFGTCGFRKSTKIILPRATEKLKAIIAKLKTAGMDDCITQAEPKINKEALRKYSPDSIHQAGASVLVDDVFWYEVWADKLTNEV